MSKPTLFHSLRVGVYLFNNKYPEEIILGGLLHDLLEDTAITENEIIEKYGEKILRWIKANSKNKDIADQDDRIKELIQRCSNEGEEALIIKAADILDNFNYFQIVNSERGIDYAVRNARALFEIIPQSYTDPIFAVLKEKISNWPGSTHVTFI